MQELARILVAEDDDSFRSWATQYLQKRGYYCEEAACGATVTEKINNGCQFDVLIVDLNMPGNSNLELVREVAEKKPTLPIILMTGKPTTESAVESINLPIAAYIVKPFEPNDLLSEVQSCVVKSKLYNDISKSRERIKQWEQRMSDIETLLSIRTRSGSAVAIDAYLTLTIKNIIDPIFDLMHLSQALLNPVEEEHKNVCNLFKCPRLDSNQAMITQAVDVLEKTKRSFKSKELKTLREKLEKYMEAQKE